MIIMKILGCSTTRNVRMRGLCASYKVGCADFSVEISLIARGLRPYGAPYEKGIASNAICDHRLLA